MISALAILELVPFMLLASALVAAIPALTMPVSSVDLAAYALLALGGVSTGTIGLIHHRLSGWTGGRTRKWMAILISLSVLGTLLATIAAIIAGLEATVGDGIAFASIIYFVFACISAVAHTAVLFSVLLVTGVHLKTQ